MRSGLAITFALFLSARVYAQSQPAITISAVPMQPGQLSIEEILENTPIDLEWRADVNLLQSYQYELTYDVARSPQQPDPVLVTLDDTFDAGENTGVVISGQLVRFRIRPQQILKAEDLPDDARVDTDNQVQQRRIILQVFIPGQEGSTTTANTGGWTFDFDSLRPPAPVLVAMVAGEARVLVKWAAPEEAADVLEYEVVYCPNDGESVPTSSGAEILELPCAEADWKKERSSELEAFIDKEIQNGIAVAAAVRSVDALENKSVLSNARRQTPAETTDFWELYKIDGGQEDGGFCFIATAAHGSYAHPVVKVLRHFRDRVLFATPIGTAGVLAYYQLSPPMAEELRRNPELAGYARVALLPIAIFALIVLLLPWIGALAIGFVVLRLRAARALAAFALALLVSPPAWAETRSDPTGLLGFGLEFRGGPYLPDLGSETGGPEKNTAFREVFTSEENPLFVLAFDVQILRGYGTAGIGTSFGFMQFVGKGVIGVSDNKSIDTTVFNILPLTGVLFYRFDWLADHYPIPLVPYVRGGLAYYFWWITTGTGDVSRFDGSDPAPDDDQKGRGGKIGLTGTVGVALMLNHLEQQAARALHANTGIRGTYLFAELQASKVDGFGKDGFDFSELNWNVGMYVEF